MVQSNGRAKEQPDIRSGHYISWERDSSPGCLCSFARGPTDPDLTFNLHENKDSEDDEGAAFWMMLAVFQVQILDACGKSVREQQDIAQ